MLYIRRYGATINSAPDLESAAHVARDAGGHCTIIDEAGTAVAVVWPDGELEELS